MHRTLLRFILACLLLLPCPWTAAGAQGVSFPDLGSPVPGHGDTTYLDLARMVISDLAADKDGFYRGSMPIEMRHIEGPDSGGQPPETSSLSNAAALNIKAGGKHRLAMLFDLGGSADSAEGFAVLALYDLAGKPRLLDAVNVAVDRSTYFRDPGKLPIGPGDDVIITLSTHFNSNQGYVGTPLILVRDDSFELIDVIHTFDESLCAYKRTQELALETVADGQPYAAIQATVTDAIVTEAAGPNGESCDEAAPEASSRDISVTYHWDGAAYVKDSDALDKLAGENAKRF
ncbi:hypothetical protein EJ066_10325 [Mesorhizobium sp. M9A.F.Ca.ET.002.03.1.2]|uniref:hypothetical protein n=1 Tax=Mesorhizobium sp. M9A.F.Ca.ET.002.03.1.2 TaxID=2493668 RepID=UPI000F756A69|nr:hypothetical protein [Mesorhizobium sp. M9A.F.Ca.ET.002.03.1.2]AZN97646.1 hypothetical protein EJ066_10325 [Mesorhizobium sp. M9A.F.Ca.ET.002.03.1.2]